LILRYSCLTRTGSKTLSISSETLLNEQMLQFLKKLWSTCMTSPSKEWRKFWVIRSKTSSLNLGFQVSRWSCWHARTSPAGSQGTRWADAWDSRGKYRSRFCSIYERTHSCMTLMWGLLLRRWSSADSTTAKTSLRICAIWSIIICRKSSRRMISRIYRILWELIMISALIKCLSWDLRQFSYVFILRTGLMLIKWLIRSFSSTKIERAKDLKELQGRTKLSFTRCFQRYFGNLDTTSCMLLQFLQSLIPLKTRKIFQKQKRKSSQTKLSFLLLQSHWSLQNLTLIPQI